MATKAHEQRGHHSLAQSLIQHLHDRLDRRREASGYQKSAKEEKMDIQKELVSLMKNHGGPLAACKVIVDQGESPCSEQELVCAISEFVGGDVAFAKLFESDVTVRKAVGIAKENEFAEAAFNLQPQVISGGEIRDDGDRDEAMRKLAEIGRQMAPSATAARQFELAFSDPKNVALAQRAHVRPVAPAGGAYPMPR